MTVASRETIHFVSKVLGARATPAGEVASVITAISAGLAALSGTKAVASQPVVLPAVRAPRAIPVQPPKRAPRQRRPRKAAPESVPAPVVEAPAAPAASKLLRRSHVAVAEAPKLQAPKPAEGTVRGVVKWFDGKTLKGALRLAGISGDVALEAATLQRSGIRRLYKDQEIEAIVEPAGDQVRLVTLSLPGRGTGLAAAAAFGSSNAMRRPRQVTVEVKRDGVLQKNARAAAEHVLGNGRRSPSAKN